MLPCMRLLQLIVFACIALSAVNARAADLQVRTVDGTTVQGEYLGTENNVVRIRTKYGVISIPSKDVVTLTAVASAPKDKDGESGAAVSDELPQAFPEPKWPNLAALVTARTRELPEPSKSERQELHRLVRNYGDSSNRSREKIVRSLQSYGYKAEPFIAAAYNHPAELPERVELLRALALPGRQFTALIFSDTHNLITRAMETVASQPPEAPPDYLTRRERLKPTGTAQQLQAYAGLLAEVEGYAATAGGPYNALFLLGVYKKRYGGEQDDALVQNVARDAARLAQTANNHAKGSTAWPASERVTVIELLLPMLFKKSADLRELATEPLKKLLPDKHPKWDAPQDEWVTWWNENKEKLAK